MPPEPVDSRELAWRNTISDQRFQSWLFGGAARIAMLKESLHTPRPGCFNIGTRFAAAVSQLLIYCSSSDQRICSTCPAGTRRYRPRLSVQSGKPTPRTPDSHRTSWLDLRCTVSVKPLTGACRSWIRAGWPWWATSSSRSMGANGTTNQSLSK